MEFFICVLLVLFLEWISICKFSVVNSRAVLFGRNRFRDLLQSLDLPWFLFDRVPLSPKGDERTTKNFDEAKQVRFQTTHE